MNKIKNADFSEGKAGPTRWVWIGSKAARWSRLGGKSADERGIELTIDSERAAAHWTQTIACSRDKYLRIDAVVTCTLTAASERVGGLTLSVEACSDDDPIAEARTTTPVLRADEPLTVRTLYKIPKGANRLRISVGVAGARGSATVHAVRAMPMIEPEEASHLLAIPPPQYAVIPPHTARRVAVVSETADDRTLTRLLRAALGSSSVKEVAPSDFDPKAPRVDALILPDESAPKGIRSLKSLVSLAEKRTIVISLPAFAALTGDAVSLRRIEQEDDPLCARVAYSGWMTRGLALDDTFTFGWEGNKPGGYVQRQVAKTTAFKAFIKKHEFETFLVSMANTESTSDRPIALYKSTEGGGLFVLDIEPIERTPSTMNEPVLPLHLLLCILGHGDTGLGQYVFPAPTEAILRDLFREAYPRFREFVVRDADVPSSDLTDQLVTIGRDDESFGLPLAPKPLILIRSGLTSEDPESVYGCFLWFKQLIRMTPYQCPYASALASRYRLAWVPSAAPWMGCHGWRRRGAPPHAPMEIDAEGDALGAVIDVASRPVNKLRVVLPQSTALFDRVANLFPQLTNAFARDRFFSFSPCEKGNPTDRTSFDWRYADHEVEVCVDPNAFKERALQDAIAAGAEAVRIEVPGFDADFPALSIHRTNVVATALEHVIGLHYGLIAVNRHLKTVHFDGFAPLAPGSALIVDKNDRTLSTTGVQAG